MSENSLDAFANNLEAAMMLPSPVKTRSSPFKRSKCLYDAPVEAVSSTNSFPTSNSIPTNNSAGSFNLDSIGHGDENATSGVTMMGLMEFDPSCYPSSPIMKPCDGESSDIGIHFTPTKRNFARTSLAMSPTSYPNSFSPMKLNKF